MNVLHQNVTSCITMERQRTCTHFVENHSKRIKIAPFRALEAFAALLIVLVISIVALTPGISRGVLAAFVLINAVGSGTSPGRVLYVSCGREALSTVMLLRLSAAIALTLTLLAAGITLAVGHGGGLYWLPAAFVIAITVAAVNAWVILVEVLR